mgnify:CR=1 FL=1
MVRRTNFSIQNQDYLGQPWGHYAHPPSWIMLPDDEYLRAGAKTTSQPQG